MPNLCQVCWNVELSHRYPKTVCDECHKQYYRAKQNAHNILFAIMSKNLICRPSICELCGDSPGLDFGRRPKILAHHYNGHENVFDVWWICKHCNTTLRGPFFHSGLITKEQAKMAIKDKEYRNGLIADYEKNNRKDVK